jgi:hypothetical protein
VIEPENVIGPENVIDVKPDWPGAFEPNPFLPFLLTGYRPIA